MKKNILLLINGFGVERNNSYNVYSAELMPTMDRLTKEKIFVSIPNNYLDYKSSYRNFSMGINEALTYSLIENNIYSEEYKSNQLLKYTVNELNKYEGSRLHIIVYWDSSKTIEQLTTYLRYIQTVTKSKIFLHIILCHKSLNDYKDIEKGFSVLNYELGNNVKIGIVTGESNLNNVLGAKDFIKNIVTEYGEKWKDLTKKVQVLLQTKTKPYETRTFSVNSDYKLLENDQILIFNFSNIDFNLFKNELKAQKYRQLDLSKISYYSLFPTICSEQIPFMYNFAVSSNYTLNSLKSINARCLIFDKKDNCPYINYYLTGLRNTVDENLKYLPTDDGFIYDPQKVLQTIQSYDKELYIINYEINTCKNIEEMKDRLSKIDAVIKVLDDYITQNNYALIISSFYGIETDLYNAKQELCKVDFSGRVPLIIDDKSISLSQFSILEGSLFDLSNTIMYNINKDYKNTGLLKKKSSLLSIFYKKSKESKK